MKVQLCKKIFFLSVALLALKNELLATINCPSTGGEGMIPCLCQLGGPDPMEEKTVYAKLGNQTPDAACSTCTGSKNGIQWYCSFSGGEEKTLK